ncbi:hypothetical protein CapIbe_014571 [Capra ibex]
MRPNFIRFESRSSPVPCKKGWIFSPISRESTLAVSPRPNAGIGAGLSMQLAHSASAQARPLPDRCKHLPA